MKWKSRAGILYLIGLARFGPKQAARLDTHSSREYDNGLNLRSRIPELSRAMHRPLEDSGPMISEISTLLLDSALAKPLSHALGSIATPMLLAKQS